MRIARTFGPMMLMLSLQGCAAAAVTAGGVGMGTGVEHTMNGIVYKTFAAPSNEVRFATLKTLDRMGMPVTVDQKADSGWKLTATANDRTIDIELQALTPGTTRMRVVANDGGVFFKDASTATEIVQETAQTLQEDKSAGGNHKRKAS